MRVDLALARGFNRQEDHLRKTIDHGRLHAVGLRGRHAAEGLERQHHVTEPARGVVDVLAHFEMALASARLGVIEGMRQARQLALREQAWRDAAQMARGAGIQIAPQRFAQAQQRPLAAILPQVGQPLARLPPAGFGVGIVEALPGFHADAGLAQQIADPAANRIHMHLRAFAFEKAEHVEVAVTLGELRPELADDFDHRFDAGVIDLDLIQATARLLHLDGKLRAVEMIQNLARCVEKP